MPLFNRTAIRPALSDTLTAVVAKEWRVLGVCAVAALITPPDPISMLAMAVPLGLLYELAVFAVSLIEKRRNAAKAKEAAKEAAEEAAEAAREQAKLPTNPV